jgi:transcriptional antiterminator
VGGECGIYGGEERGIQSFGREIEARRAFVRTMSKWKSNIKMNLKK